MDKKIIIARIDEIMREKGITHYELKENADISTTIYQWRKNAKRDEMRIPSLRSIEKICDYLDVSLPYFFSFDKEGQRDVKNKELSEALETLTDEQIKIIELLVQQFKR